MKLDIYQVDAFTSEPFHGNPAAVVPLESWLSDATMLDIAAENNLAETAFFVASGDGFEIKWFTPAAEIDLCGHATVASAYVLYNQLGFDGPQIKFQSKSGELRVTRDGERFVLDFPSRPAVECEMPAGLIEALGAAPTKVLKSRDYLAVYETEADVLALEPEFRAIGALDVHAVIVTAPGERSDFVSRFFAPAFGVDEDPVTGSAHCTLTPYWAERLGKETLFARQVSKRGGEVYCELAGDRVHLGGDAVLYLRGEIMSRSKKALERDIEYRRAEPKDSQAISALLLEAFGEFKSMYTPGAFEYTTPGVEIVRGRFDEGPMWVAFDGDVIVGTVSGLPEADRFYIRSMAVKPGVQGRGIGNKLLSVLETDARERGFEKLYLYTSFVLPAARRLYEKSGFRVVRETPPDEWFDMAGLEMEKVLT